VAALFDLHKCPLELLLPDRSVLAWPSAALEIGWRRRHASGACLPGGGCSGEAALRYGLRPYRPDFNMHNLSELRGSRAVVSSCHA